CQKHHCKERAYFTCYIICVLPAFPVSFRFFYMITNFEIRKLRVFSSDNKCDCSKNSCFQNIDQQQNKIPIHTRALPLFFLLILPNYLLTLCASGPCHPVSIHPCSHGWFAVQPECICTAGIFPLHCSAQRADLSFLHFI